MDVNRNKIREAVLLLALVALYLAVVRPFFGVTADDAYISFRYAQNWAHGCGPVYNCGEPAVEGYTNFLWMAMAALFIKLGADVVPAMRLLGLFFGAAGIVALVALARRLHRGPTSPHLAGLALASTPFWAINAVSGLETAFATTMVLVATMLSLDLPRDRRPWLAGAAWGVCYMIRPEGLVLGALAGLWILPAGLLGRQGLRHTILQGLRYGAGLAVAAGPFLAWRMLYYGSFYPNTYHAKKAALGVVLPGNMKVLANHPVFFITLMAAALLVLAMRREMRLVLPLLLAVASAFISLSVHNNFWMPGHRLYLTAAALIAAVAAGLGDLVPMEAGRASRWLRASPAGLLLGALLISAWWVQPDTMKLAHLHYAKDNNQARSLGLQLRKKARKGDWLATRDAGMVPFYAGPGVKVLDIHERSLNDRNMALMGWNLRYIMNHNPRWIIFASTLRHRFWLTHPIEGRIFHMPGFIQEYRQASITEWHHLRFFYLFERIK